MANDPRAEDLLKVIDINGKVYWCDEIEFENVQKKEFTFFPRQP